jgi:DNA polymerase III subunit delta
MPAPIPSRSTRNPTLKLNSDALPAHLEQHLLPAYLVSGDDPLLTAEAADAIRARARSAGFTEREIHFMERGTDWNDVRASANNLSLFSNRRIVEIRLPSGKPGTHGGAALVALLEARDPDRVLLVLTPRLERDAQNAEWVRTIESQGAWVQVWPVNADRLVGWLRARSKRIGLSVPDDALEVLADRTEGNLLAANQELQKLRLAVKGDRVSSEEVLASVADSARFDVFQLGEAVLAGDAPRALRVLAGLRSEGVEPTLVLWSVTKAVRDTWGAFASPGGRAQPWARQAAALDSAVRRAPRLPFLRLTVRATRADRMIKGRQSGEPWDEIALLIMDMCGTPALSLPRSVFK